MARSGAWCPVQALPFQLIAAQVGEEKVSVRKQFLEQDRIGRVVPGDHVLAAVHVQAGGGRQPVDRGDVLSADDGPAARWLSVACEGGGSRPFDFEGEWPLSSIVVIS